MRLEVDLEEGKNTIISRTGQPTGNDTPMKLNMVGMRVGWKGHGLVQPAQPPYLSINDLVGIFCVCHL